MLNQLLVWHGCVGELHCPHAWLARARWHQLRDACVCRQWRELLCPQLPLRGSYIFSCQCARVDATSRPYRFVFESRHRSPKHRVRRQIITHQVRPQCLHFDPESRATPHQASSAPVPPCASHPRTTCAYRGRGHVRVTGGRRHHHPVRSADNVEDRDHVEFFDNLLVRQWLHSRQRELHGRTVFCRLHRWGALRSCFLCHPPSHQKYRYAIGDDS